MDESVVNLSKEHRGRGDVACNRKEESSQEGNQKLEKIDAKAKLLKAKLLLQMEKFKKTHAVGYRLYKSDPSRPPTPEAPG